VWLLSDSLTLSPIITLVVYAMTLAQAAPGRVDPRLRISSYSVWETAVFVVNVLAFVLMGLQARMIIERLSPGLERHARPYHAGDCSCVAAAISWARPDRVVRVLRGSRHARDPGIYAAAIIATASPP
jgi:NhaP-type Na+/H+ or K+/H+ antiporter